VKVASRKEAKVHGLERYFTGTACKRGHVSERYTKGAHCVSCTVERRSSPQQVEYRADRHRAQYYPRIKKDMREARLRRCYGITLAEEAALIAAQDGLCAICRNAFSSPKDRHVDHCHLLGTVRGILCGKCNSGLGFFRDNEALLQRAIVYLQKFQERNSVLSET
jgi:hypothetical protein